MEITLNEHDFNQRYKNTIFKITWRNKEHLYHHNSLRIEEEYDDDTEEFTYTTYLLGNILNQEDVWEPIKILAENVETDFIFPELGAINCETTVAYFSRHAHRQWKRTYTAHNNIVHMHVMDYSVLRGKDIPTPSPESPSTMRAIFYPIIFSPQEALEQILLGKRIGAAFSPNFYFVAQANCKNISLAYKTHTVGEVKNDTEIVLYDYASHLREELAEHVNFSLLSEEINV